MPSSRWTHRSAFCFTPYSFLTSHSGNQAGFGFIKQEINCVDNRYLVFHEGLGFGPGDDKNLKHIQDFILRRTDPGCPSPERLHAVWWRIEAWISLISAGLMRFLGSVFPQPAPWMGALEKELRKSWTWKKVSAMIQDSCTINTKSSACHCRIY